MTEPETFTVPLPFPPHPPHHPPHPHDVIFFRNEGEPDPGAREHEDIMLRRVPRQVAMRYRAAAGGRGMTHAQYLTALVDLHARVRDLADGGDEQARGLLDELGLQTVSV